jgi:hypothetical protein
MKAICPYCDITQKQVPVKTWSFGKLIENRTKEGTTWGASINCSQYYCVKCGKSFISYLTTKGKYWTNPKSKKTRT